LAASLVTNPQRAQAPWETALAPHAAQVDGDVIAFTQATLVGFS
jgi:hypothetical protein